LHGPFLPSEARRTGGPGPRHGHARSTTGRAEWLFFFCFLTGLQRLLPGVVPQSDRREDRQRRCARQRPRDTRVCQRPARACAALGRECAGRAARQRRCARQRGCRARSARQRPVGVPTGRVPAGRAGAAERPPGRLPVLAPLCIARAAVHTQAAPLAHQAGWGNAPHALVRGGSVRGVQQRQSAGRGCRAHPTDPPHRETGLPHLGHRHVPGAPKI